MGRHLTSKVPHVKLALRYAEDALTGKKIAGELERQACERFLADLEREDWEFTFDTAKAERACRIIENFPHVKGQWAGTTITLEPWQCFIICNVFGWVHKETGLRRFRTVYIEVSRKNAKSTLTSAVALLMLALDDEEGAEVYSAATTRDQARIVFNDAKQMARRSSEFRKKYGVNVYAHSVAQLDTGSKMQALSAEGSTLDGLNTHFGGVDELHAHKTRDVFDVIETSTGSRTQSILWLITTAGSDKTGICYEQRNYVTKILQGIFADETYFGVIYTVDKADLEKDVREKLFTDPKLWAKSNPNYGVSVLEDDFKRLAAKALRTPSAQANFLTKRLNVWVSTDSAWMDMLAWEKCANPKLCEEDFKGMECMIALDLASKKDIAVNMRSYRDTVAGVPDYYFFGTYYLPERAVKDSKNAQYKGWAGEGLLTVTGGNVTDYKTIEEELQDQCKRLTVREIPFDPFQATQLSTRMIEKGLPMVEVGATVRNFSEPMKEVEARIFDQHLHHDGNPVLTWMMSNVVAHTDKKDNIFPNKERDENKIDGPVAMIMAMNRWVVDEVEEGSVYDERGLVVL